MTPLVLTLALSPGAFAGDYLREGTLTRAAFDVGGCAVASANAQYELDVFFGEPTVRGGLSWQAGAGTPSDCIQAGNLWVKVRNTTGAAWWIDTQANIPPAGADALWDIPSSPNWDRLLRRTPDPGAASASAEDAKSFWKSSFSVVEFTITGVRRAAPSADAEGDEGGPWVKLPPTAPGVERVRCADGVEHPILYDRNARTWDGHPSFEAAANAACGIATAPGAAAANPAPAEEPDEPAAEAPARRAAPARDAAADAERHRQDEIALAKERQDYYAGMARDAERIGQQQVESATGMVAFYTLGVAALFKTLGKMNASNTFMGDGMRWGVDLGPGLFVAPMSSNNVIPLFDETIYDTDNNTIFPIGANASAFWSPHYGERFGLTLRVEGFGGWFINGGALTLEGRLEGYAGTEHVQLSGELATNIRFQRLLYAYLMANDGRSNLRGQRVAVGPRFVFDGTWFGPATFYVETWFVAEHLEDRRDPTSYSWAESPWSNWQPGLQVNVGSPSRMRVYGRVIPAARRTGERRYEYDGWTPKGLSFQVGVLRTWDWFLPRPYLHESPERAYDFLARDTSTAVLVGADAGVALASDGAGPSRAQLGGELGVRHRRPVVGDWLAVEAGGAVVWGRGSVRHEGASARSAAQLGLEARAAMVARDRPRGPVRAWASVGVAPLVAFTGTTRAVRVDATTTDGPGGLSFALTTAIGFETALGPEVGWTTSLGVEPSLGRRVPGATGATLGVVARTGVVF